MNCDYHADREAIGTCVCCGKAICPECKVSLHDKLHCNPCAEKLIVPQAATADAAANTSGQGRSSVVPQEIRGWNWGGFFFTWIWGIGNRSWLAVLFGITSAAFAFVADEYKADSWISLSFTIITSAVIGIQGNQWAWQNKKWADVDHFKKVQRRWAVWGLVTFVIFFTLGIMMVMLGDNPVVGVV